MPFCPSCGQSNPEGARFCRECRTKMPGAVRLKGKPLEQQSPVRIEPEKPFVVGEGSSRLTRLSLYLSPLGVPGIVLGALALKRREPGRYRALLSVIIGLVMTSFFIILIVGLTRPDPLTRRLTSERFPAFSAAAKAQIDKIQEQADRMRLALGPGADQELASVYNYLEGARIDIEEMQHPEAEADLDSLQQEVLLKIDEARAQLGATD